MGGVQPGPESQLPESQLGAKPDRPAGRRTPVQTRIEPLSRYLPPRSTLVKAIHTAGRLFPNRGRLAARLDEAWLLERAAQTTGLDDFGGDAFRERLRPLRRAYEETLQCAGLDLETERGRFAGYQKRFDIPAEIAA